MSRAIKELAQEFIGGPIQIQVRRPVGRFLGAPSRRGGTGLPPHQSECSCVQCHRTFKPVNSRNIRCVDCRPEAERIWQRAAAKKWRRRIRQGDGRCTRCDTKIDSGRICRACSAYVLAWKKRNPEALVNGKARRAGRGQLSKGLAKRLLKLQKAACVYCRIDLGAGYHLDHVMPLAAGGANEDANMQLLCPTCNLRKGAKDPVAFAQRMGLLL